MKNKYKILITIIAVICCNQLFAQHGHSPNHSMTTMIRTAVRPQPRATGIFNATANANANAKIHANSNSVFGTGNTPTATQLKNEDERDMRDTRKQDKEENKNNSKKHK